MSVASVEGGILSMGLGRPFEGKKALAAVYNVCRGGHSSDGGVAGTWTTTKVRVEAGVNNHDMMITANGGDPKVLKMYASSSKSVLTAAPNTCGDVSQPIVEVIPNPAVSAGGQRA